MRYILALCLILSGCQTASIDTAIQQNLPKICSAASTAHLTFTAATAVTKIPDKTVRREAAAWAILEPICADPHATTASILVAAASSYSAIVAALAEAKKVAP